MKQSIVLAEEGKINSNASLRDRQSIVINAPIQRIWKILNDIASWPEWNKEITYTKVIKEDTFVWKMKGSKTESVIRAKIEPTLISWTGKRPLLKLIQVWKLEETDDNQTIVMAEESMHGVATLITGHLKLHSSLVNWLDYLKKHAETT